MDSKELINNNIESLIILVCSTSLWASKQVVEKLFNENGNETASWYHNTRRFSVRNNEQRRTFVNGEYLDDNVCANLALKKAIGIDKPKNFTTCHIYDRTTYDIRYHTSIPNLVLVPSVLYALTDNSDECKDILKYCSYKRYGFYINSIPEVPKYWSDDILKNIINIDEKYTNIALGSISLRTKIKKPRKTLS